VRFYTTKEIINWTTTIPFMLKGHLELLKFLKSTEGSFYPSSSHMYSDIAYLYKPHKCWKDFSFLVKHGFLECVEKGFDSSLGEYFEYKFTVPGLAIREIMISIGRKNFLDNLKELMNVGINAN